MANINFYSMTNDAISQLLGQRLKLLRLRQNKRQQTVHNNTGIALGTIKGAEKGCVKLPVLIALLREYDALETLETFLPEVTVSPLQLAKLQGKKRQRARERRE